MVWSCSLNLLLLAGFLPKAFMEPHAPGRKTDADLHVLQSPPSLVLTKGDQAILNCSFPAGDPNGKGAVSWNRFSLEEDRSSGRAISLGGHFSLAYPRTSLGKGDGSLIISNISWEDAGIYVCKVWLWGKEEKEGNGTRLVVYGHPNQPEIYLQVQGQKEGTIVLACRTFGFHPAPVNFSWHSSDLSITALGPAELWKSESGDFQSIHYVAIPCSSTWKTFTCSVRHVSLVEPLSSNYTYDPGEHGLSGNQLMEYLNIIKICLVLGLLMSITLTVGKRCKKRK
ncbi:tapasin-related protein [Xenopus laevis]|uniref:Tapasin-related protein n=1 Tax=Xenopus laevis TaxID=8355 RepID=A0A8J1L9K4_XENLA|nr:tapasin-related protein [Xenopus laevis]